MRRPPLLPSLLLLAAAPLASAAPPVSAGYAQGADYLDKEAHPERYNPLNVLDGRDTTVWCAPQGEGVRPVMTVGFKGVATVDEVRVYTGNGSERDSFKKYGRAKKIALEGKDTARSFTVEDKKGQQTIPLNPPVSGAWLTLEVTDIFPGSEAGLPVCLTDIIFYSGGKPLNGTKLAPMLKYDARMAPLLGTWFAGLEGAPDRFLSFYVDGTYSFVQEPLGGAEPSTTTGTYTASNSRLSLEVPKKGKSSVHLTRKEASDAERGYTLTLEGELPDGWNEPFRSKP